MVFDVNRFHICVFITWQLANFAVGQYVFTIFINYYPKWRCGDGPVTSNCTILKLCPRHELVFEESSFQSPAEENDWFCENSIYQSIISLTQYIGVLVGTVTFGSLSDRFGRKPIGILVLVIGMLATYGTGIAVDMTFMFFTRFLSGLSIAGVLVVICSWVMESILSHQRMFIRGFFNWGWTRVFITVVCYLTQEWRHASFVCSAFFIPALLLVIFVIPESPIWLHSKGLTSRMIESEKFMAKIAGIPYQPVPHKIIHSKTLKETLKTKGLFKKLSVLWIMWFIIAVCGFANDLNSGTLSGNLYLNQLLLGILVAVSKMFLLFVDSYFENFKRRTLHQVSQIGIILCFSVLTALLVADYDGVGFLVIYLLGTMFIEYNWDAVYLCAIESMETSSRASAVGSCSLMARIGSLLTPFLVDASKFWPPAVYISVIVLGSANLLISYFFLQETKNVNLDDVHVDETEEEVLPMMEKYAPN